MRRSATDHGCLECDACDQVYGDGFSCSKCKFIVHWKCAYVFKIPEIYDHPSHDGHCLKLLTTGAPNHTDPKCHICGKNTKRLLYRCSVCKLNVDIDCIFDAMSARAHLNMPWHHHPLLLVDLGFDMFCEACDKYESKYWYFCPRCRLVIHEECVSVFDSPEITHLSHARHPLKLITSGAPDYTDQRCHICGDNNASLFYHCDKCKFNLDMRCAINTPPPVALSNLKVNEHTLTLMPRLISFVCDACGMKGDRAPYVCVQCDFMIFHQQCAQLPRVINVNHHDHRVSYTYPLGPGEWRCGVCWEEIDWSYGAYSCSICPNYAIHSLCATRDDVWDGKELDGVPEKFKDIKPFKINDDNTITHFAHKHNMSLSKDSISLDESILCGACVRPISSHTFYYCSDCSFILHEKCANLSRIKRHFLSPKPLILRLKSRENDHRCNACLQVCCKGFIYTSKSYTYQNFDLLCSSIPVPFIHGSHLHPLLYLKLRKTSHMKTCQCCGNDEREVVLGCVKCNYFLDFRCATLPLTVKLPRYDEHPLTLRYCNSKCNYFLGFCYAILPLTVRLSRYDDHPLTLCYGDENTSGKYWCDICERETNPKNWFYTCKDCGVTLHILCVTGDIRFANSGGKISYYQLELLLNNRSSRPFCYNCKCRCPGPFILRDRYYSIFYCSFYCCRVFKTRIGKMLSIIDKVICPPWVVEHNT